MNHDELLSSLRLNAGDRAHRCVLADALLEGADPRGEAMAAELAGLASSAEQWAGRIEAVLAAAPEAERFRVLGGMVTELSLPPEAVPGLDRRWLASEPLVCLETSLPSEEDQVEGQLAGMVEVLSSCRGVALSSRLSADTWALVCAWLGEIEVECVELDLGVDVDGLGDVPEALPSIRIATLKVQNPGVAQILLWSCLPGLRRLRLAGPGARSGLEAALGLPQLVHLDVRGVALEAGDLDALRTWLEVEGRSLRHEGGSLGTLGPPDLDDVFGAGGRAWEAGETLRARVAALPGEALRFACARGRELQLHLRDTPSWRGSLGSEVSALAARAGQWVFAHEGAGVSTRSADLDDGESALELPEGLGAVRGLSVGGGALAVEGSAGWWRLEGGGAGGAGGAGVVLGAGARRCLTLLEDGGMAWAQGSAVHVERADSKGTRLAELVELGEPIAALAASDGHVFALAGRSAWSVAVATGAVELLGPRRGGRARIVAKGDVVAWLSSRTSVLISRAGTLESVAYAASYSGGCGEELALADLALADDGTVAAALEHGGMNLLGSSGALKADEFPGEPVRRWIFVYRGEILIAG